METDFLQCQQQTVWRTVLLELHVQELAEKEPEDGVFRLLRQDVTRFLTTILIGTTYIVV